MPFETVHLKYELSRRQRWDTYVRGWLPALPKYLLVAGTMVALTWLASHRSPWFLLFLLGPIWVLRGLIGGVVQVALIPTQRMDILIDEDKLGFMAGSERWWVHLDSIVRIERLRDDLWTFVAYHGEAFDVPVSLVTEETLAHVRSRMEWARTPEGVEAAVNRGRRVLGLKVPAGEAKGEGGK